MTVNKTTRLLFFMAPPSLILAGTAAAWMPDQILLRNIGFDM